MRFGSLFAGIGGFDLGLERAGSDTMNLFKKKSRKYCSICGAELVTEDVKGVETDVFRMKAKMFRCKYKEIDFRIIEL